MNSIIFHIDVNSAYLSWTSVALIKSGETLDLRTIPSIIGSDREKKRGVVLAKSIPAKKYGIKTGEPVIHALRKCPNLKIVQANHKLYSQYSHAFISLLQTFSKNIEKVSVDECYMDLSDQSFTRDEAFIMATKLKDCIRKTLGFTVNIGISTKKVLAKMASDFRKPDKIHTLYPDEIKTKMWHLPVNKLYMVGKSSETVLKKLEINTIGDLANADISIIMSHLKKHGKMIWEYANGIDDSIIQTEHIDAKHIGSSTTLAQDIVNASEAKKVLKYISMEVASRLSKSNLLAGSISTEIKYASFQTVSHQSSFELVTCDANILYQSSCKLFDELWNGDPIRLLGVHTSKLTKEAPPIQMNLFEIDRAKKEQKADKVMEKLQSKFGSHILKKGI